MRRDRRLSTYLALIVLVALVLSAIGPPTASAANPLSWSVPELLANGEHPNEALRDISCPSEAFCVASDAAGNVLISDHPTGGANGWVAIKLDQYDNPITGVSCPTSSFCVAVDSNGSIFTTTEPTGGASAWHMNTIDANHYISSVSCISEGLCVAVDAQGQVITSTNPTGGQIAWSVAKVAELSLNAVSCVSGPVCVATNFLGAVVTSTEPTAGASAWHLATIDKNNTLEGVSCPTAKLCVVMAGAEVLTSTNPTGGASAWSTPSSPIDGGFLGPMYVACASETLCVATDEAGHAVTSTNPTGGASAWKQTKVDTANGGPDGVWCVAGTTWCAVVNGLGDFIASSNPASETWNAPEHIDSSTSPNLLNNISCPSVSLCFTGDTEGGIAFSTNPAGGASTWSKPVPVDPEGINGLSCVPGLCVAVDGSEGIATSTEPTGGASKWSHIGVNTLFDGYNRVSCASTKLCVATSYGIGTVATSTDPTGGASAWTTTTINGAHGLGGVSCPSESLCVVTTTEGDVLTSTDPTGGASAWHLAHTTLAETATVSCPTTTLCVVGGAEGKIVTATSPTGGAGAWSTAVIADSVGYGIDVLSCASERLCVGGDEYGNIVISTTPTGNTSAWTTTNVVGGSNYEETISGIDCPSNELCAAVNIAGKAIIGTPAADTGGGLGGGGGSTQNTPSSGSSTGNPSAGGSGGGTTTATISPAQITALLAQQLMPSGKAAKIATLLKNGGLTMSFKALEAGTLVVGWYEVPPGAKLAKHVKAKPVLVASGQMTFLAAGTGKIKIRLTAAGKRLLKHAKRLKLTAKGTFTPNGRATVSTVRAFALRR